MTRDSIKKQGQLLLGFNIGQHNIYKYKKLFNLNINRIENKLKYNLS